MLLVNNCIETLKLSYQKERDPRCLLKHRINNKEKEENNKKKDKEINYLTTFVVLCNKACV